MNPRSVDRRHLPTDGSEGKKDTKKKKFFFFFGGGTIDVPSGPDGMDTSSFGHVDDELDVGVVVVVGTTGDLDRQRHCASLHLHRWMDGEVTHVGGRGKRGSLKRRVYLDVLIGHPNVVGVGA